MFDPLLIVLAALCVLSARWFLVTSDRARTEHLLVAAAMSYPALGIAEALPQLLMKYVMAGRTVRYDLYVYAFSGFLGHPCFVIGRWVAQSHLLTQAAATIYAAPPLMIATVYGTYVCLCQRERWIVLKVFFLGLLLEVPVYFLCPVSGPRYAFSSFPRDPGAISPHLVAITAPANGMPSVHTAMALWIAALLWRWPLGRAIGVAFVALTAVAILGNGEHYLLDVIFAVPYSWLVWQLARRWHFAVPGQKSGTRRAASRNLVSD
jgi:hypothetical protein